MIAPEILINLVPLSRLYDLMQPSYDQIIVLHGIVQKLIAVNSGY